MQIPSQREHPKIHNMNKTQFVQQSCPFFPCSQPLDQVKSFRVSSSYDWMLVVVHKPKGFIKLQALG
ncbi:hypothetical protein EUGRSUZ_G02038 [Eucalyptus grandis]|uniref:Uncharacterized protein n=2 Tax=Eucalyptus grandis TaxID=71139 RepID=A0ACC3K5N7_EUCGR|nr:hypothetical protein EUGRSUZ_G02038 [Eucalyptus grandis]